ncbi:hypothetical protein, partial [Alkalibacillus haloalkaliphilus]|uniref:hypothetical protein n=1 Tax=Alkalibacillus haloalkaliphilus TaxID=94136 RepID=UPI0029359E3D
ELSWKASWHRKMWEGEALIRTRLPWKMGEWTTLRALETVQHRNALLLWVQKMKHLERQKKKAWCWWLRFLGVWHVSRELSAW